jgi:hypothetical protein
MGGYGSGRSGGRPTVECTLRLDIDALTCRAISCLGTRSECIVVDDEDDRFYSAGEVVWRF